MSCAVLGRSLRHGVDALRHASEHLDLGVADRSVQALLDCRGRRYFTGIGKSGHAAARMASSLSSIGLAAHWVHGAEWSHGELGALGAGDLIFAVSQSGSTQELVWLADHLRARKGAGVSMLSLTGDTGSPLALRSQLALTSAVPPELETLGALPTSSLLAQSAWSKCPPWQRPGSAPAPPLGALGGPMQLGAPRVGPGH